MPVALSFRRTVALHLALLLFFLPAFTSLHMARAEVPGIKKTLVVGGAAVGALALISAFTKKAASKGVELAVKSGAKTGLLGALSGLFARPWILLPVTIGVGIVAYYMWQKYWSPGAYGRDDYNRYNQTDGRRYENPAYRQQVFGNGYGHLNPYENVGLTQAAAGNFQLNAAVGANGLPSNYTSNYVPTFMDQVKSALSFGAYRPAASYLASSAYGGSANVNLGGASAFGLHAPSYVNGLGTAAIQGPNGIGGTAFDLPGIGDPARLGRTDVVGRGLTNGDETLALNRTSMHMGPNSPVASDSLAALQSARDAAYEKMVTAVKGEGGDPTAAINAYRSADEALKARQAAAK